MKREHPYRFKRNIFIFPELEAINKAAYWDYQRERVYLRSNRNLKRALRQPSRPKRALVPDTTIECPRPRRCPKCNSTEMFGHGKASKTVLDIRFMRHGVKRWISRYRFHRYKCLTCGATFFPQQKWWTRSKFGNEIVAYALYQNIGLRLLPHAQGAQAALDFLQGRRQRNLDLGVGEEPVLHAELGDSRSRAIGQRLPESPERLGMGDVVEARRGMTADDKQRQPTHNTPHGRAPESRFLRQPK